MDKFKVTLTMHDSRVEHPDHSMPVLALMQYGAWERIPYSKKHNAFNVYDDFKDASTSVPVIFWAELPAITSKDFGIDPYSEDFEPHAPSAPEPTPGPDPVSRMREYSIDADTEQPDYGAYPVGE